MQSWLSVNKQDISSHQMPVDDLATNLQLVCNSFSLLTRHILQVELITSVLVLHDVCTWMLSRSIDYVFTQSTIAHRSNTFWECQLPGHKDWYTNLVSCDVGVGRNDTPSAEVDTLAHHFHSEHAFLALKELSDTRLCFVDRLGRHR
jgi:hypothetical protein